MSWPRKRTPTSVLGPHVRKPYDWLSPNDSTKIPNQNMGREQKAQPGWADHGSSGSSDGNYLRGPELADREEREAYGRPLQAAYRYLLGPTPRLLGGDRVGARAFLQRIEHAIDIGGWTRSEWTRLRRLRDKWKARATGGDPRFDEVGNGERVVPDKWQTANIKQRKIVQSMQKELDDAFKSRGD